MGWDAQQKKFVMGAVDNSGGYASSMSDGWVGDTMTFEGPWNMMSGTMKTNGRDQFIKKGDGKFMHAGWIESEGKWVKVSEENCTSK